MLFRSGGDGGGVVLRGLKWGERALAVAQEVLAKHFGDDVAMFAFKVSPKGYVYVRLDKLTNMSVTFSFHVYSICWARLLIVAWCCVWSWTRTIQGVFVSGVNAAAQEASGPSTIRYLHRTVGKQD